MSSYAHGREAIRVKVKKCEPNVEIEWRKFSVDPLITTMEVLYTFLAKAFDIKSDFTIKYRAYDAAGNEIYLIVRSDWDLEDAFLRIHNIALQTSTEPCLTLQIDVKPFTGLKEFETTATSMTTSSSSSALSSTVIGAKDLMTPLQQSFGASQKYVQTMQNKLPGLIINQMGKTFSLMQKAFNLTEETMAALPPRIPVSDTEFRQFLDALGQIQRNDELRKAIFWGGIEPGLRRVVWKHLLNVYPTGMNGNQRMDYMKRKSDDYYKLRETWKTAMKQGCVNSELAYVTSMVKKDVLRTDRLHPFYAGSDDNQNIASLFNILTTYALNHPTVSYCQGMSDIASPLLVTMNDEAQAYICFVAIMIRLKGNFMMDGIAMTQKFTHLTEALRFYDPDFWEYLKSQQADDLLFCYRWLLLELKREFPFDDALRMLEVQWSSIIYPNCKELSLFEKEFEPDPQTTKSSNSSSSSKTPIPSPSTYLMSAKPRESAYTKVCALRRQSSSQSLSSLSSSFGTNSSTSAFTTSNALDENISKHSIRRRKKRISSKSHQSLDETKMTMLIEAIERNDTKSENSRSADVTLSDVTDDEVFTSIESPSIESKDFNFHPTNPFLEDAQLKLQSRNKFLTSPKATNELEHKTNSLTTSESLQTLQQIPKSIANLQNKNIISNYSAVSNIIAKQLTNNNTNNVAETLKRVSGSSGGHFKNLKEKLAASNKKGFSIDDLSCNDRSQQKLVKNFNEFLNFTNKTKNNKIADTSVVTTTTKEAQKQNYKNQQHQHQQQQNPILQQQLSKSPSPSHPLVQLTRSGYNSSFESDTSSIMDTTWSNNSTAPTALQQAQTLSSHSLHLELNSLPYTPEKTPTLERKEDFKGFSNYINTTEKSYEENQSSPTDEQDYYPISTEETRELSLEVENLDRQIFRDSQAKDSIPNQESFDIEYKELDRESIDLDNKQTSYRAAAGEEPDTSESFSTDTTNVNPFMEPAVDEVEFLTSSIPLTDILPEVIVPLQTTLINHDASTPIEIAANAAEALGLSKTPEHTEPTSTEPAKPSLYDAMLVEPPHLPPPNEFGGGNPFLIFLCLTLLLQHRNTIMKTHMDYNEIAMHFDKMIRKHNVVKVLNQARDMYINYLKIHNMYKQKLQQYKAKQKEQEEKTPNNSKLNKQDSVISNNREANQIICITSNNSSNQSKAVATSIKSPRSPLLPTAAAATATSSSSSTATST